MWERWHIHPNSHQTDNILHTVDIQLDMILTENNRVEKDKVQNSVFEIMETKNEM